MATREFVYADESGVHEASRYCIIAGFQGAPGQFKALRREWLTVLQKPTYRVPEFHGNVFFNRRRITNPRKNPYLTWTDSKADKFLGELAMTIAGRKVRPVGCAVDIAAFNSYSFGERCVLAGYTPKPSRRSKRAQPAAYHLAFRLTMGEALADVHPDTEVHLVIAQHAEYQQRALEGYQLLQAYDLSGAARQLKSINSQLLRMRPCCKPPICSSISGTSLGAGDSNVPIGPLLRR
jgi:hypothetical protein